MGGMKQLNKHHGGGQHLVHSLVDVWPKKNFVNDHDSPPLLCISNCNLYKLIYVFMQKKKKNKILFLLIRNYPE